MRTLIIVCSILALAACSDPKIDGSSKEAAQASIQKVRDSLPESQRKEFDQAVAQLTMSNLDFKALFTGTQSAEAMADNALASLNGKTASQVITEARALQQARKDKERQQALAEIEELKAKQAKAQAAPCRTRQVRSHALALPLSRSALRPSTASNRALGREQDQSRHRPRLLHWHDCLTGSLGAVALG
jgi:hypothetical protein